MKLWTITAVIETRSLGRRFEENARADSPDSVSEAAREAAHDEILGHYNRYGPGAIEKGEAVQRAIDSQRAKDCEEIEMLRVHLAAQKAILEQRGNEANLATALAATQSARIESLESALRVSGQLKAWDEMHTEIEQLPDDSQA